MVFTNTFRGAKTVIKEVQDIYDNGFFVEHRYGDTAETGGWKSA